MGKEAQKYIRVPVKLTPDYKEWLDKEQQRTGISQNTLLLLGLETLMKERSLLLPSSELMERINRLEEKLKVIEGGKKELHLVSGVDIGNNHVKTYINEQGILEVHSTIFDEEDLKNEGENNE